MHRSNSFARRPLRRPPRRYKRRGRQHDIPIATINIWLLIAGLLYYFFAVMR